MDLITFLILCIIVGFALWMLSSINSKLELLITLELKKNDIKFNDKDLNGEFDKYRDK